MEKRKSNVRMWGYLPAASLQRAPILHPTRAPQHALQEDVQSVCSGGCGFALAITGTDFTWLSLSRRVLALI